MIYRDNPLGDKLKTGDIYPMNVIGEVGGRYPFGFVEGCPLPVFIMDNDPSVKRGRSVKPGDKARVYIEGFQCGCATGRVTRNEGCFLKAGDETSVSLTMSNPRDIRDALSIPDHGGGIYGVFTIVKRAKCEPNIGGNKCCRVRINLIGNGSNNRHFVVARPLDRIFKRDVKREVYYAVWPPDSEHAAGIGELYSNNIPGGETLGKLVYGVPEGGKDVLFLTNDDRQLIVDSGGRVTAVDSIHYSDAIERLVTTYGGDRFRLIVTAGERVASVKRAFQDFLTDLTLEELPPRKSLSHH
jgi:hypothetical protein